MKYEKEINRRKTFAIISHPDAGKTTLTEKLLLFGGAIQTAGAVKSNKIKKQATSDFMEIERQRGISVATSVMSFEYKNTLINLLDTPGHKDFAEDTYRTLTAVDSVILVIDSVNGVEEQTRRLMEVCRMRDTPVIVFVNKMDRDGKFPFDLLDEIEKELNNISEFRQQRDEYNEKLAHRQQTLLESHQQNLLDGITPKLQQNKDPYASDIGANLSISNSSTQFPGDSVDQSSEISSNSLLNIHSSTEQSIDINDPRSGGSEPSNTTSKSHQNDTTSTQYHASYFPPFHIPSSISYNTSSPQAVVAFQQVIDIQSYNPYIQTAILGANMDALNTTKDIATRSIFPYKEEGNNKFNIDEAINVLKELPTNISANIYMPRLNKDGSQAYITDPVNGNSVPVFDKVCIENGRIQPLKSFISRDLPPGSVSTMPHKLEIDISYVQLKNILSETSVSQPMSPAPMSIQRSRTSNQSVIR